MNKASLIREYNSDSKQSLVLRVALRTKSLSALFIYFFVGKPAEMSM